MAVHNQAGTVEIQERYDFFASLGNLLGGCYGECQDLNQEIKSSAAKIDALNEKIKEASNESRHLRVEMADRLKKMKEDKDTQIEQWKEELDKSQEEKAVVDERIEMLNEKLQEVQREYANNILKSQEMMAKMVEKKDENTKELIVLMINSFKQMNEETVRNNKEIQKRLFDIIDDQQKDMRYILKEMKDQLLKMESKRPGMMVDREERNFTGAELYRMVEERKLELRAKAPTRLPVGRFMKVAPLVTAFFASISGSGGNSNAALN